ncbi:multi-sensor signal transduction histidine kinase [Ktedonobacter racemifer DSM 44963]|uniref:histidine kinase n=1 Tax=Ktedonobacter racemifer DSM 44963 TaxID=485913 RepID=D6TJ52_KTERA|nr:multi-sensor signal transduction histidine kinase [Ktedonobacter racemifer DSM 44963]
MESSVQSEMQSQAGAIRSSTGQNADRLVHIREEIVYLNTIGKRFVAAFDRFQVHRALLAALQEIYSFTACCILLKGPPNQLFIIPSYPLSTPLLEAMIHRITSAAHVMDFPHIDEKQLAATAYLDAPDELAQPRARKGDSGETVGSCLNIPLTVESHIIGLLSLFDEQPGAFDTNLLQLTAMIADYAAIALENVRLRERENALWRQAELERQRLELVIRSMAEGLLITDAEGAVTSLNQSARHMLGQANVHFQLNIPLHELAKENAVPWLERLADTAQEALQGKTVTNQELFIGEGNETVPLTLHVSAAPLYAADDVTSPPIGIVAVLNDVTSMKQVERLKDEFVSVVSHELRTPLTAIKGYTQHLVRRVERRLRKLRGTPPQLNPLPTPEPPESYDLRSLNIIQSQTEHLERLVNDLLDLSQLQWGQLQLQYEEFYLTDLLNEYVHTIQNSAEQHTLYLDIQTRDTRIIADRKRIGQVIGNILDNAIKYSPNGGKVTVRLQRQQGEFLVSIIDEGIGVSLEHYDHIFERFYRVHNTSTQQYSGIGLGLFVTREIITRHGGRIWFTNNQHIGTTFYFTLPPTTRTASHELRNH